MNNSSSSVDLYSRSDLQSLHLILWSSPERPSTKFDIKLNRNLKLSKNYIFYLIDLTLSSSFLIVTKKVMCFLGFSPKHSS